MLELYSTHTHTFNGHFLGLPGWAGTRKVKPIWILLKQETVSGSGISWAICKSAPRSRQITTLAPYYTLFAGRMPFPQPNQQCQSTEGIKTSTTEGKINSVRTSPKIDNNVVNICGVKACKGTQRAYKTAESASFYGVMFCNISTTNHLCIFGLLCTIHRVTVT